MNTRSKTFYFSQSYTRSRRKKNNLKGWSEPNPGFFSPKNNYPYKKLKHASTPIFIPPFPLSEDEHKQLYLLDSKEEKKAAKPIIPIPVAPNVELNRCQDIFIAKANIYLEKIGKLKLTTDGQCHGLLWTWVENMHKEDGKSFYSMYSKITDSKVEELLKVNAALEAFLEKVEKTQNSEDYIPEYEQREVYKTLGFPTIKSFDALEFKQEQLSKIINDYSSEGVTFAIIGEVGQTLTGEEKRHSIGIFCRKQKYLFYDSNSESMYAKSFNDTKSVVSEVWDRLRKPFNLPEKETRKLDIDIVGKPSVLSLSSSFASSSNSFFANKNQNSKASIIPPIVLPILNKPI